MSPLARCDTFRIHRAESCRNPRVFGEAFKPAHDLANDPERGRPQWSCAALMAFLETLTKVNRSSQRHRLYQPAIARRQLLRSVAVLAREDPRSIEPLWIDAGIDDRHNWAGGFPGAEAHGPEPGEDRE